LQIVAANDLSAKQKQELDECLANQESSFKSRLKATGEIVKERDSCLVQSG
jgi:hypothetical protein